MKQTPMYRPAAGPNSGLTRYGSAPGSLLTSIADSVISEGGIPRFHPPGIGSGSEPATLPMTRLFTGVGGGGDNSPSFLTAESSCGASKEPMGPTGLQRSSSNSFPHHHPVGEISGAANGDNKATAAAGGGAHLLRQSSSPAGFFSHLMVDNGVSVTRGIGHYSQPASNGGHQMPNSRLKSQLSFSRQEPLSQISEISIPEMGDSMGNGSDEAVGNVGRSFISSNYSIGSWDDTNSIAFSVPSSKRAKACSDDLLTSFSHIDSQFSLPTTSLEMAAVEKLLQAQQDSVAFKVRAKRGCATHPRSIAERERRTRISEKLRKLEELVPNMDKQTSTADMLDLAVQHIKELQQQVQDLHRERANCTCGCKEEIP